MLKRYWLESISVSVYDAAVTGRGENRIGPSEGLSTSTDTQEILAGREFEATFQVCKKLEEIAGEVGLLALSNEGVYSSRAIRTTVQLERHAANCGCCYRGT